MELIAELEDRGVAVQATVPVPHPSILVAVMVAGVIALFPFVFGAAPTTGLVNLGVLTAGLFLFVVLPGSWSGPDRAGIG